MKLVTLTKYCLFVGYCCYNLSQMIFFKKKQKPCRSSFHESCNKRPTYCHWLQTNGLITNNQSLTGKLFITVPKMSNYFTTLIHHLC